MDAIAPDAASARAEMAKYRKMRSARHSPRHWLEDTYLRHLDTFLRTGATPMPCHALRSSCFIDPWGVVYPCITYTKPMGRLRDTGMRLDPIWNAPDTAQVQSEIWKGDCPQCWTACEAYQSILGNVLPRRQHPPAIASVSGERESFTTGPSR
jgi:radical SAM protein with 4Fe4S-binding SPASM domain